MRHIFATLTAGLALALSALGAAPSFTGTHVGNGAGLTNVVSSYVNGTLTNKTSVQWFSRNGVSFTNAATTFYAEMTNQQPGDVYVLGPGYLDLGTNCIVLTNNVTLRGSGKYATVLMGEKPDQTPIVGYTDNNTIQDLTIWGTLVTGEYQTCLAPVIGYVMGSSGVANTNTWVINVRLKAASDGWVTSVNQGGTNNFIGRGLSIETMWDAFRAPALAVNSHLSFDVDGFDLTRIPANGLFGAASDIASGIKFELSVGTPTGVMIWNNWRNGVINLVGGTNGASPIYVGKSGVPMTNHFQNIIFNTTSNAGSASPVQVYVSYSENYITNLFEIGNAPWKNTKAVQGIWYTNNLGLAPDSYNAGVIYGRQAGLLAAGSKFNGQAPTAITPSASPFSYTNLLQQKITVFVGGVGATNIGVNGGDTALISGSFPLEPWETLTVAYTNAPTITFK